MGWPMAAGMAGWWFLQTYGNNRDILGLCMIHPIISQFDSNLIQVVNMWMYVTHDGYMALCRYTSHYIYIHIYIFSSISLNANVYMVISPFPCFTISTSLEIPRQAAQQEVSHAREDNHLYDSKVALCWRSMTLYDVHKDLPMTLRWLYVGSTNDFVWL